MRSAQQEARLRRARARRGAGCRARWRRCSGPVGLARWGVAYERADMHARTSRGRSTARHICCGRGVSSKVSAPAVECLPNCVSPPLRAASWHLCKCTEPPGLPRPELPPGLHCDRPRAYCTHMHSTERLRQGHPGAARNMATAWRLPALASLLVLATLLTPGGYRSGRRGATSQAVPATPAAAGQLITRDPPAATSLSCLLQPLPT